MKILTYRGLDTAAVPGYEKLAAYLAADDFRSADVKKVGDNLYRARLDRSNRLLLALYRQPPPLVIIGSAGSGKTALTLEKMKDVTGDVLYVTRSLRIPRHSCH